MSVVGRACPIVARVHCMEGVRGADNRDPETWNCVESHKIPVDLHIVARPWWKNLVNNSEMRQDMVLGCEAHFSEGTLNLSEFVLGACGMDIRRLTASVCVVLQDRQWLKMGLGGQSMIWRKCLKM